MELYNKTKYIILLLAFCTSFIVLSQYIEVINFKKFIYQKSKTAKVIKEIKNTQKELVSQAAVTLPHDSLTIELTKDGKRLIAFSAKTLYIIEPLSLKILHKIRITSIKENKLSYLWAASSCAISPDQKYVLILNKYYDIYSGKVVTILDKNLFERPEVLDISPLGNIGMIMDYSFHSEELNSVLFFNLKSGKLINKRKVGEKFICSKFCSNESLLSIYNDGNIVIEDLNGGNKKLFYPDIPTRYFSGYDTINFLTYNNTRFCILSSFNGFGVYNFDERKMLITGNSDSYFAVSKREPILIYDDISIPDDTGNCCGCIDYSWVIQNFITGEKRKVIGDIQRIEVTLSPDGKFAYYLSHENDGTMISRYHLP